MYYYLYQIKNKLNEMVYVGIHKTKDINDGYMGSGKILSHAIKKYGLENFEKTILANFDNEESMRLAEKMYVDDIFVARPDVYNIVNGGGCGWKYVNENGLNKNKSLETRKKISKTLLANYPEATRKAVSEANKGKPKSLEQRNKISESMSKIPGREKTQEEKDKISNAQKSKVWINDGVQCKRIENTEDIPIGWGRGRLYAKRKRY
jgi:hypothetical protein